MVLHGFFFRLKNVYRKIIYSVSPHNGAPLKLLVQYITIVLKGLRETLNFFPMMPKEASLSNSCTLQVSSLIIVDFSTKNTFNTFTLKCTVLIYLYIPTTKIWSGTSWSQKILLSVVSFSGFLTIRGPYSPSALSVPKSRWKLFIHFFFFKIPIVFFFLVSLYYVR